MDDMASSRPNPSMSDLRAQMEARVPAMLVQLERFVNTESPSLNNERLDESARVLAEIITEVTKLLQASETSTTSASTVRLQPIARLNAGGGTERKLVD